MLYGRAAYRALRLFAVPCGRLKSVLEYSSDKIKLAAGKKKITFHGDNLHIDSFTPQGAVVEGMIVSVDFSDAD